MCWHYGGSQGFLRSTCTRPLRMETVALGGGWMTVAAELEFEAPVGVQERGYGLRPAGWGAGESGRKPEWLSSKAGMGQASDRRLSGREGRVKEPIGEVGDGWRSFWRSLGGPRRRGVRISANANAYVSRETRYSGLVGGHWPVGELQTIRRAECIIVYSVLCPQRNKK